MNISVVIPNYNGEKILEKSLSSVFAALKNYKKGKLEIIVSDDHSNDQSVEIIQNFIDKYSSDYLLIRLVRNTGKQGFSANVDLAVQHAKGDIILLLNTDVVPENDFLEPLIRHFSNEKVFAVGCAEHTADKGRQVTYGRSVGKFARGFISHQAGTPDSWKTFWVSCGSGAFRKEIWDVLRGLDEIYNPFYWEDIDLSYRAVKSGYAILFESKSIVHHYHEQGAVKSFFTESKIQKVAYRNHFIFMWKNMTDANFIFRHLLWLPYHLLKAVCRRDGAFVGGFLAAIFLYPKIIQSRTAAKKRFILLDKEVLLKQL